MGACCLYVHSLPPLPACLCCFCLAVLQLPGCHVTLPACALRACRGSVDDFKAAAGSRGPAAGAMVSVKSDRQPEQQEEDKEEGRKGKQQHSGKKKHGGGQHGGKPHKKHKSG